MIKINLLPVREKAKEENIRKQLSVGALLIGFTVALLVLFAVQQQRELSSMKEEKGRLDKQLADLKKEVGDLAKIQQEKEAMERRKEAIANLSRNRLGVVEALDQLTSAKPSALYFTHVEQKNVGAPWDDFTLSIQGVATDNEVIAQFMRNLQKVEAFRSVDLEFTKAKAVQREAGAFQEFKLDVMVGQKKPPQPEGADKKASPPAGAPKPPSKPGAAPQKK
jgi:type IV pilus assembly protein PilN